MYKKIVVAIDGSDHSFLAAEHAIQLAKLQPETHIEGIQVLDYEKTKADVLHSSDSIQLQSNDEKLQRFRDAFEAASIPYKLIMKQGEPAPMILEHARDTKADLIIIGSRGLNPLQEVVLGSVSSRVAKRAKCSVMIVK
ncbi:Nucleotide-binding universal stress protein, UspA family [Terribacillus halophilus]|uniref:Nucleotide-binding universal stress protein, UspA family n=1 Tax=Terribacillus halophilus TaxID=361279 RepID=A0A1G6TBS8_9BACI|nr:universal stress protein [Terribacillus halophilus]SDD26314.1 Nucleotide-binding universal stress protein, UspA family [Terribacillus halophilus]